MYKRILLILPLFLGLQISLRAQDMVRCNQLLEDAREAYTAGMVELVPELLLPCIESGLTGALKMDAYKLVINAYLFDYLPDEADKLMSDFLDENPDYEGLASDPAEFKLLLDAHKQRRAEEAAALVIAARNKQLEELAAQKKAEEQSKLQRKGRGLGNLNTDRPRLGFLISISGSQGSVMEPYSVGDPSLQGGKYSLAPGFVVGANMDLPLSNLFELRIGLQYNQINLSYSGTPFDFTTYKYKESENKIQLPLSMALYLNPKSQTRAYIRLGVVADYLISASASGTRTYDESGTFLRDVELQKVTIKDSRSGMNMQGMLGLGVNIPLQKSFLFVEAAYSVGFFQSNRAEHRYNNQDMLWVLYHLDSDFRINQLLLNVGMTWNLK